MQQPDGVRRRLGYGTVAFLVAIVLTAAASTACSRVAGPETSARRGLATRPSTAPNPAPSSTASPPLTVAPTASATAAPASPPSQSSPTAQMAALAAGLPPGSVSVAARDLDTGREFTFGSSGGLITASVVKVDILETLLLQVQASGDGLTDDEDSEATSMIEDSDDDAADDLWEDIGGGTAMAAANSRLQVPCTEPDPGPYWGLTTTCAAGQIQILEQLENLSSPLQESSRDYILDLMENVTPSQALGVPVVADSGTDFAVKNGWLNTNGDTDWAVTSDGIVTYDEQTLLIAAITQNDGTVYAGVDLVQQLAQVAAQAVTS